MIAGFRFRRFIRFIVFLLKVREEHCEDEATMNQIQCVTSPAMTLRVVESLPLVR